MADIRHEPARQRFVLDVAGAAAYLTYRTSAARVLDFDHTFVPPSARGAGIASQLTAHALAYARSGGYKVIPSCPFVASYLRRHPEFRDVLA